MTFRIEYTDGATDSFTSLCQILSAASANARREWEDQEYESIEEALDERHDWLTAIRTIDKHHMRAQDGAVHLDTAITYDLPNGAVIRITAP